MNTEPRPWTSRRVWLTAIFVGVFTLGIIITGAWVINTNIQATLEKEMSSRLLDVGRTSVRIIQAIVSSVTSCKTGKPGYFAVQAALSDICLSGRMDAAYIVDRQGRCLADSRAEIKQGEYYSTLEGESSRHCMMRAWAGFACASPVISIAGYDFERGYVPLVDRQQNTWGILVLEADADFLFVLRRIRGMLMAAVAVSFAATVVLVFIVRKLMLSVTAHQEKLYIAERQVFLGRLAAAMAHEIRNPLGIIKSTAQTLKARNNNLKDGRLYDFISAEADRLNRLTTRFLGIYRGKKPEYMMQKVDLSSLVRESCLIWNERIKPKNGVIDCIIHPQSIFFTADPDSIRQIVNNLLSNSSDMIKPSSGGHIRITLLKNENGSIFLKIEDDGPGIGKDELSKVMEPFYSTKSDSGGLGLFVVNNLVSDHGGRLELSQSELGGLCVEIYFPETGNHEERGTAV